MPTKIYQMKYTRFIAFFTLAIVSLFLILVSCNKDGDSDGLTEADKTTIANYVEQEQLNGQYTNSGLYYEIQVPGTSNHPTINSNITVSYKGYYTDGTVLDEGEFFSSFLYYLIRGWQEGIPYIGEGGKIKLVIPSYLAYGNGVLVFDVTLHYFQ